jgi:hypothetical protein
MLVGIIIALAAGLGILLMSLNAANIAPAIIEPIMQPLTMMADKLFFFLAALTPILAAVIPIYILRNRDSRVLLLGALYGLGLMFVVMALGLDTRMEQLFHTSWYGSTITAIGSALGSMASAVSSILYGLALWLWGAFLAVVDAFLGGLGALGRAASRGRQRVKKARRRAHRRMGERI